MSAPMQPKFWSLTAGNLIGAICVVVTGIYAASAFATKTASDSDLSKSVEAALKARIEVVDSKSAAMDNRVVVLETSMIYIRESLSRIERFVTPAK